MNTMVFGELSPEHIPLRHEVSSPHVLAVLSRQGGGDIYMWTGGFSRVDLEQSFKQMSVTKVLVSTVFWVQSLPQLDGQILPLDASVPSLAPPGVTLWDLLAHCSGPPFDNSHPNGTRNPKDQLGVRLGTTGPQATTIAPFMKRIYSSYDFGVAASFVATKLIMPWTQWVVQIILHSLGMSDTKLVGSSAWEVTGLINDLAKLAAKLLNSTRTPLSSSDIADFTRPVHPSLRGMSPGYGHHRDDPQGTGVEIHGRKASYYLPPEFPSEVFGHFGQLGSSIQIGLGAGVADAFLGGQNFDFIHKSLWLQLSTQMRHLALNVQG